MASISQIIFSNEFSGKKISLKFVPKGPIDRKSTLIQVMVCRRTVDKALPEPMLTQYTDAYM